MVLLAALMACLPALAANEADELASDQISVRELMRLETGQALQRVRTAAARSMPGTSVKNASSPLATQSSAPRLVAIYGVGHKLMAEVQVDGQKLIFVRGRPEAVGPGRTHAMRLLGMSSRCVEVSLHDRRDSLCADPTGSGGR